MPTINQLIRHGRTRRHHGTKFQPWKSARRSAACARVYTTTPKKQTRAKKVARVRLTNGFEVTVIFR